MTVGVIPPHYRLRDVTEAVGLQQCLDLVPHLPGDYPYALPPGLQLLQRHQRIRERTRSDIRVGVDNLVDPPAVLLIGGGVLRVAVEDVVYGHPEIIGEPRLVVLDPDGREGVPEHHPYPIAGVEQRVVEIEEVEVVLRDDALRSHCVNGNGAGIINLP